jgi:hypothetical protein
MPTDFFLTTERFILSGRMVGVENLFIERNAELTLSEQAHTSQLKSLVMWYTDAPYDSGDPGVTSVAA